MKTTLVATLTFASLAQISNLIHRREISSADIVRALVERIASLNPQLNCFITVLAEQALKQAEAMDTLSTAGTWLGPLHGVPIALKDNIATADIRTTAGSRILADWVPRQDATVVKLLKAAGAILVGKTSLYEFAHGDWHPDYGETHNPWDLSRSCGASSSGSACAVAAGLAYGSLGTDTGGSVRIPAALCGVVGLKPTYGLVSRRGVIPLSYNLDAVGPMARTVKDVAYQLRALAGFDGNDIASVDSTYLDWKDETLDEELGGIVVGIPKSQEDEVTDPEIRSAYEAACGTLENQGATVTEVDLPNYIESRTVQSVITATEGAEYHRQYSRTRLNDYSDGVRQRILVGEFLPAVEYVHAQRVRQRIRSRYEQIMDKVDVLAMPVSASTAPIVGEQMVRIDDSLSEPVIRAFTRYTPAFNLTGQPALSMPCGHSSDELPIAFQLVGRYMEDWTVLRVAAAYERSTPWHRRHPELAL